MAEPRSTMMDPPIEELLDKVDSKFTLVALAASRARQVNRTSTSSAKASAPVVPPQVASVVRQAALDRLEEIAAGKATYGRPDPEEGAGRRGGASGRLGPRRGRRRSRSDPLEARSIPAGEPRRSGTDWSGAARTVTAGPLSGALRGARRERRHRRLQGGRGLPAPGGCRGPRHPGADRAARPASSARPPSRLSRSEPARRPVSWDELDPIPHTRARPGADLVVVAPATAA